MQEALLPPCNTLSAVTADIQHMEKGKAHDSRGLTGCGPSPIRQRRVAQILIANQDGKRKMIMLALCLGLNLVGRHVFSVKIS